MYRGLGNIGTPLDGIEEEEFNRVLEAELTPKQALFVHGFMRHRNRRQAALDAGYGRGKPTHASAAAEALMKKPKVRELINALLAARMRRIQATPERIEEELAKVAFASFKRIAVVQADGTMYLDFNRADDADLAGLVSFKCEISHQPGDDPDNPKQVLKMDARLADKLGALRSLAQIRKMIGSDGGADALVDIADAIREGRKRAGME